MYTLLCESCYNSSLDIRLLSDLDTYLFYLLNVFKAVAITTQTKTKFRKINS